VDAFQNNKIQKLEELVLTQPQVLMPVEHSFCNGLYARTMHIPKDTVLTGAIHADECFFVVRKGSLIVTSDSGNKTLVAGDMHISKAGEKRAGVTLEDVVCTTFHQNILNETEPEAIWEMYALPNAVLSLEGGL
jgi:hypothetical protein